MSGKGFINCFENHIIGCISVSTTIICDRLSGLYADFILYTVLCCDCLVSTVDRNATRTSSGRFFITRVPGWIYSIWYHFMVMTGLFHRSGEAGHLAGVFIHDLFPFRCASLSTKRTLRCVVPIGGVHM